MTIETAAARRRTPLIAVLIGSAISLIGSQLTAIAVPWFVLVTTGSAAKTGITGAAAVLPMALAGTFGGTFVDRLGYKRAGVLAGITSGLAVALIPLLYHTVGLAFWQLLVLVFLSSLLDAPGAMAQQSLIPDLAQLSGTRLERANSAFASIQRGAGLIGAPLAGILIALFGASNVIWIDAASFLVLALVMAVTVPGAGPAHHAAETAGEAYFEGLRQGFAFIRADALMVTTLIFVAVSNFLGSPLFAVILPVYAKNVLNSPVALGVMLGGFGAGALAGALGYGAIGHRLPRRPTVLAGFICYGLALLVLAATPGLIVTTMVLAAAGLAAGPLNPVLMTVAQERIPEQMRGRIFGLIMAVSWVSMPAGMLLGGLLIQTTSIGSVLLAIGAAQLLVSLGMIFNPALHRLEPECGPG